MKHSKYSFQLKYLVFFIITTGFCFGIGFLIGAFPEQAKKLQGQGSEPLKILFSEEEMIPRDLLLEFEKSAGVRVDIQVTEGFYLFQSEINKADILFAPLAWFGSLKEPTNAKPLFEPYLKNLFPDFLSSKLASAFFLPVFWSVENSSVAETLDKHPAAELSLWGVFMASEKTEFHPQATNLLAFLLEDSEHLARWAKQVNKATTFQIDAIEDSLRPQQIRNYQLSKLKILDRLPNVEL